ncbi:MAG: HEAT repeat domain-containing protein, partial [bacterium]
MEDHPRNYRRLGAWFLAECGATAHLLGLVRHEADPTAVVLAMDALVEQGFNEVCRQFEEDVRSGDSHVEIEAAELTARLAALLATRRGKDNRKKLQRCQELLLSELRSPTDQARAVALRGLAESGLRGALPRAYQLLHDPAAEVKLAAADAILKLGDDEQQTRVLPLFSHPSQEVRKALIEVIAEHDNREGLLVRGMEQMLASSAPGIRTDAALFLRHHPRLIACERLDRMLADPAPEVRREAVAVAEEVLAAEECAPRMRNLVTDEDPLCRQRAVATLGRRGCCSDFERLTTMLNDKNEDIRFETLNALVDLAPDSRTLLNTLQRRLRDKDWSVRQRVIKLLGEHGDERLLEVVVGRFNDEDEDVRREALQAACELAPHRTGEFARAVLRDEDRDVADRALSCLEQTIARHELVDTVLKTLGRVKGESGEVLLDWIQKQAPNRFNDAIDRALDSNGAARTRALEVVGKQQLQHALPRVRAALRSRRGDSRLAAAKVLQTLAPDEARRVARNFLRDDTWNNRLWALETLSEDRSPELVDDLLPLAPDDDEDVRREAILLLARFPDPRVVSEMISSVNDVYPTVREAATACLEGADTRGSRLTGYVEELHGCAWQEVVRRVDAINRWAQRVGQELLGRSVTAVNYRQGYGRTRLGRQAAVQIEVTDVPVTSGHPHGDEIVRGLALHELGHHLCDHGASGFLTCRGIAASEDIDNVYDILCDERLERVLRARRPGWGVYFDRLASYVFARQSEKVPLSVYAKLVGRTLPETRDAIERGKLPGVLQPNTPESEALVELSQAEMLALPRLVPLPMAFLACLRCGFDPTMHPDPRVAESVAAVPRDLKDLPHKELLAPSRRIAKILGIGLDTKKQLERLRERLRKHRASLRGLQRAIERLAEIGQPMAGQPRGASGIRMNRPPRPLATQSRPTPK